MSDTPHALAFLGVELDGWHHLPAMTIRDEVHPAESYVGEERGYVWVACSCGWATSFRPFLNTPYEIDAAAWHADNEHQHHAWNRRVEEEQTLIRGNACRYCFAPMDDPTPLYCSDAHKAADRARVPADVLSGVLAEFSDDPEPALPGEGQEALW